MAPQSSSGSTPTPTLVPSNTTSSADGRGKPGGLSSSSSLPFSFLVTFVAIFLFFLGCGLSSRRVTRTLRRNLGLEVTGLGGDRRVARIPRKRPLLWDAFPHEVSYPGPGCTGVDDRVFSRPWDVLAVSATVLASIGSSTSAVLALLAGLCDLRSHLHPAACPRSSYNPQAPDSQHVPVAFGRDWVRSLSRADALDPTTASASHSPSGAHAHCFAKRDCCSKAHRAGDASLEGLAFDPEGPMPDQTPEGDQEVQALQVVVLVCMPSPGRARAFRIQTKALEAERRESGGSGEFRAGVEVSVGNTIGEYLLGTVRVPWKEG